MGRFRSRILVLSSALLVVTGAGFLVWAYQAGWFEPRNEKASCANCRSFIEYTMKGYSQAHHGWFPRGGKTPLDSLGRAIKMYENNGARVRNYTSHALQKDILQYWEENKTISKEVTCYRYNEGLHEDDPIKLIMMYYHEPTRWECRIHKRDELGRPVMDMTGSWQFVPEKAFQRRQKDTLAYLEDRRQAQERDGDLAEALTLAPRLSQLEGGRYELELIARNEGASSLRLTIAGEIALTIVTKGKPGESVSQHIRTLSLEPRVRDLVLDRDYQSAISSYSGNGDERIVAGATFEARCWMNSVESTVIQNSVLVTMEPVVVNGAEVEGQAPNGQM